MNVLRFFLVRTGFDVGAAVETGIFDRQRGPSSVWEQGLSLVLQLIASLMRLDSTRGAVRAKREIRAADNNLFAEDL